MSGLAVCTHAQNRTLPDPPYSRTVGDLGSRLNTILAMAATEKMKIQRYVNSRKHTKFVGRDLSYFLLITKHFVA